MSGTETSAHRGGGLEPLFVTTRWSVVLTAKDLASPESASALEALCRQYWYPLYALVRGMGYAPHDAQDLTQEFFARLLAREYLRVVDPEKGRFRTFLRMALRRFLANEWEKARTQKRGGGIRPMAFDSALAEVRLQQDPSNMLTPDRAYDRRWALALLQQALGRLEREYDGAGRLEEFELLKPHLTAERGSIPYAELGVTLKTSEGAARVAIHRLRKRFREVFSATVADTVATPDDVDAEMAHVLAMLSQG